MQLPKSHPRHESLRIRELIAEGIKKGITSEHGLIAHGRGEAFDYLLGEKTNDFALGAIEASAALLLDAKHPVISVNGNSAALVPKELAELSNVLNCPLEINIFHASKEREIKIKDYLLSNGAKNVLLPENDTTLRHLDSNRKYANPKGILEADVVFVPLEDGDRTEALVKNGKKVITVDLNPLSRTAQEATITIVDNLVRAVPLLIKKIIQYKKQYDKNDLNPFNKITNNYNNKIALGDALMKIRQGSSPLPK
ncbi:phosphopantothenate/pantothenate synthetase [Candidatus Woesearchaeota archaeon]|nr:phosphopantothenate/pantothenate synthetase [Candidatus Woesearchaeota archaeon]